MKHNAKLGLALMLSAMMGLLVDVALEVGVSTFNVVIVTLVFLGAATVWLIRS